MTPDLINGLFECFGALVLAMNVRQLLRDKVLRGVHVMPTVFYTGWGVWNLYYYPTLDQWFSFFGGIAVVTVNAVWVMLAVYYTRGSRARA